MVVREEVREEIKKELEKNGDRVGLTRFQKMLVMHPEWGEMLEEAEQHWLTNANNVLKALIDEIKNKISNPLTTMTDLVRALDTISNKYNIHLGKPTSLSASYSLHESVKKMTDEELDARIDEIEKHFLPSEPILLPSPVSSSLPPNKEETPPFQKAGCLNKRRIVQDERKEESQFDGNICR